MKTGTISILLFSLLVCIALIQGQGLKRPVSLNIREKAESNPSSIGTQFSKPVGTDVTTELLDKMRQIYGISELRIRSYQSRTTPGARASGVVVRLTKEQITLDTTPCSNRKKLIEFHKEYDQDKVSDINCRGKKYSRVQVKQN